MHGDTVRQITPRLPAADVGYKAGQVDRATHEPSPTSAFPRPEQRRRGHGKRAEHPAGAPPWIRVRLPGPGVAGPDHPVFASCPRLMVRQRRLATRPNQPLALPDSLADPAETLPAV